MTLGACEHTIHCRPLFVPAGGPDLSGIEVPPGLRLRREGPLAVVCDEETVVEIGTHWSLDMADFLLPLDEFRDRCSRFLAAAAPHLGDAPPTDLDVDSDYMPGDDETEAAALALLALAADPGAGAEDRLFAKLYAWDLCARDEDFETVVLRNPVRHRLMCDALDKLVVHDPWLLTSVHCAQARLAEALPGYVPAKPTYRPWWETAAGGEEAA